MNDGRYSTFIDMKKMKENGLICDEKALIHRRQIDEICRIIKERMEYGEYNPNQQTDNMSRVCKDWKQAIDQAVQQCLDEDDLVEDLLYAKDCFEDNEYAQYFKSKLEDVSENEDEE